MAAPNIEQGFQESLKRFQTRLSPQERDDFKQVTLRDLQRTVLQIQARQAAKADAMNLRRIQRFLEAFEQWGKIIDVFLNASEFVAFVWGPMKLLLQVSRDRETQVSSMFHHDALPGDAYHGRSLMSRADATVYKIASNFAEAFDTLLDAYEQIGESIPMFEQYRELFNGKSHMDEALARIYDDVLEFHRRALRFFTLPTWRKVFRGVWNDFKSRFGNLLDDLRRHKTLIEMQATILHFQQYQSDRKNMFEQLDRLETDTRKRKFVELMQWLAGSDSLLDHQGMCQVRHEYPNSGTWLLKQQAYAGWRMDSVPLKSMLWLHGNPGAGKTVLTSLVIEDCQKDLDANTAYFYCKYGDPQRTTCVAILRTLLAQLLTHDHALLPWLHGEYLTRGQLFLSEDLCKDLLKTVLQSTPKAYLVVDGLDECNKQERKLLLSRLTDFIATRDNQDPGKLRVMVVSQNEPDIRKGMSLYSEIALKVSDNSGDIERFVRVWSGKIQDKFELEDDQRDHITELTCQGADGMFLFAKLVMENLHAQINVEQLQRQISSGHFPDGLEQAYERIFHRISTQSKGDCSFAKLILGWMTCARRPLKWHEIQGAYSIKVDDTQDADVDFAGRKPREHIRNICGSLVTQLPGDRLELVHHTARCYLINTSFVQPSVTECHLAITCLNYLTFECFEAELPQDSRRTYLLSGHYAFQDYAVTHWSDHLSSVVRKGPNLPLSAFQEIEEPFESAVTNFAAQYQLFERQTKKTCQAATECESFKNFSFYDDLCHVYAYVQDQAAGGHQGLDTVGPSPLGQAVNASRSLLEDLDHLRTLELATRHRLDSYYGSKWYKCSKATCFYFHEGFKDRGLRKTHDLRHEIPFRCSFEDCETGHKLGFTKQKDLEKHMSRYHPEVGRAAMSFTKPNKAQAKKDVDNNNKPKHAGSHKCDICDRSYSRATILRAHKKTHNDAEKFTCGICGKVSMTAGDKRRHEEQHSKSRPQFFCRGDLDTIPPSTWGCGKPFSRKDALASHHRTPAGRACIARKFEAEKRAAERERQPMFRGWVLPADGIREKHPDFQVVPYDQLIVNGSEDDGGGTATPRSSDEDPNSQGGRFEGSTVPSVAADSTGFLTPRPESRSDVRQQQSESATTTPQPESLPLWPSVSFAEDEELMLDIETTDQVA